MILDAMYADVTLLEELDCYAMTSPLCSSLTEVSLKLLLLLRSVFIYI